MITIIIRDDFECDNEQFKSSIKTSIPVLL